MLEMRNRIKDNESGFTLIELLVVILIIGILAAIAIPVFLNQRKSANEAALKSDIHSLQLAMSNCSLKQTAYPDVWVNWAGKTIIPDCVAGLKISNTTNTHAFDFGAYYGQGFNPGDAYCIEANNDASGTLLFFRSDKGTISTTQCQNQ